MDYLIVVDMQNDFINGVLGTPEAQAIVPRVVEKVKNFDGRVLFTQDTHDERYLNTQEGKKLPVAHCIKGAHGWQIQKDVAKAVDIVYSFEKPIFASHYMVEYLLNEPNVESIELVGVCTDICVISNALMLKANFPEIPITVDANCCAGVTPESHKNALAVMKMCQIEVKE
jgi:nicotinamidase-related amidase